MGLKGQRTKPIKEDLKSFWNGKMKGNTKSLLKDG